MGMIQIDENLLDQLILKALNNHDTNKAQEFEEIMEEMFQTQINEYNKILTDETYHNATFQRLLEREKLLQSFEEKTEELLNNNYTDIENIIEEIYREGRRRGLNNLGSDKNVLWTTGDKNTLRHLLDYDMGLIKDVSEELRGHVADSIFQGIMQGESIPEITDRIKDIPEFEPLPGTKLTAQQRAELIARTETMRAQNTGALNTYKQYGLTHVEIIPGPDACDDCIDFAETYNPLTIEEAEGVLPLHPNCGCVYGPVLDEDLTDEPVNNVPDDDPVPEELKENINSEFTPQNNTTSPHDNVKEDINNTFDRYISNDDVHSINVNEITGNTNQFRETLIKVKSLHPPDVKWRVDVHEAQDYKDCKLYITNHDSTIAITKDKDIISVCANPTKDNKDSGRTLMEYAVKQGGVKLDSFDGNYRFYRKCGFEPVSWCKFDPEFSPQGWKPEYKSENVIFFKYTGKKSEYEYPEDFYNSVKPSKDYDTAMNKRDRELD